MTLGIAKSISLGLEAGSGGRFYISNINYDITIVGDDTYSGVAADVYIPFSDVHKFKKIVADVVVAQAYTDFSITVDPNDIIVVGNLDLL